MEEGKQSLWTIITCGNHLFIITNQQPTNCNFLRVYFLRRPFITGTVMGNPESAKTSIQIPPSQIHAYIINIASTHRNIQYRWYHAWLQQIVTDKLIDIWHNVNKIVKTSNQGISATRYKISFTAVHNNYLKSSPFTRYQIITFLMQFGIDKSR